MVRPPCGRVVDARRNDLDRCRMFIGERVGELRVCGCVFLSHVVLRCWVRDGIDSPGSRTFGFDVCLSVTGGGMVSRKGGRRGNQPHTKGRG